MSKQKIIAGFLILLTLFFMLMVWLFFRHTTPSYPQLASHAVTNYEPTTPPILKVDLPIFLDGVPSIIHPVVVSSVTKYAEKSYSGEKVSSHIDMGNYRFAGDMFNLVFEDIATGEHKSLFAKNSQKIQLVDYPTSPLKPISNPNQPLSANELKLYRHFLYQVQENNNSDRQSNSLSNQSALYISDEKGNGLKKLHPDEQYFIESRWISDVERYYFTTKADSNHDGKITLQDDSFNYYIDFKTENPTVHQYDLMPK